jgi:prepilin-type N-terminal cleavage/methylation domain-containing protein
MFAGVDESHAATGQQVRKQHVFHCGTRTDSNGLTVVHDRGVFMNDPRTLRWRCRRAAVCRFRRLETPLSLQRLRQTRGVMARSAKNISKNVLPARFTQGSAVALCCGMSRDRGHPPSGFTLIETLVAMAILLAVAVSLSPLLAQAAAARQRGASRTLASVAARNKVEQLRALPWTSLPPSPALVLQHDVDGYSDCLPGDEARPTFVRRWSIVPLPADPAHLLLLRVVVLAPVGRIEASIAALVRRHDGP